MTEEITDEQVVQACREWQQQPHTGSLGRLRHITGQPDEACQAAMAAARDRGLIEWGVTLDSAWVTPAGDQLFGADR